jgi:acetyl esterase/lipase
LWEADLRGLAPAFVLTAEYDSLRDEGEEYARWLAAAGVPVVLTRYPGVIHGFFQLGGVVGMGREAVSDAARHLKRAFAAVRT